MDDNDFLSGLTSWKRLAVQTAKRLERQIGRPHSEFNRDCLTQELLWHVCHALRRSGVKNRPGFVTTVVRNRARDILRRARTSCRSRHPASLDQYDAQLFIDRRQHATSRIQDLRQRLDCVLALLTETQQLAVATACQGEAAAAAVLGISRRQLRKVRSEVRVEFERRGLREFLSMSNCLSNGLASNQRKEVS